MWTGHVCAEVGAVVRHRSLRLAHRAQTLLEWRIPVRSVHGWINARSSVTIGYLSGVSVIWCDKLASVPSVGIAFEPFYQSTSGMIDALSPLLSKWANKKPREITIDKVTPFSFEVQVSDGFSYGADHSKVFVDFKHRVKVSPGSGGGPVLQILSKPRPYSELLKDAEARLIEIYEAIDPTGKRPVNQIGIVSSTQALIEEIPPGIMELYYHLGKPWKNKIHDLNVRITAEVSQSEGSIDRCIHQLTIPAEEGEPVLLNLDYQRTFATSANLKSSAISERLPGVSKRAREYFEALGAGEIL